MCQNRHILFFSSIGVILADCLLSRVSLLHNNFLCCAVLHTDDVDTLLWLIYLLAIDGVPNGSLLVDALLAVFLEVNLVDSCWVYFNYLLELLPIICSLVCILATFWYIQCCILSV